MNRRIYYMAGVGYRSDSGIAMKSLSEAFREVTIKGKVSSFSEVSNEGSMSEEIDLCGLKACEYGCGRPKPSHRITFGLGQCYWCSPALGTMLCDADDCQRGIDGRGHPFCEDCQRKHATKGRSSEIDLCGHNGDALIIEWRAENGGEARIVHQDEERLPCSDPFDGERIDYGVHAHIQVWSEACPEFVDPSLFLRGTEDWKDRRWFALPASDWPRVAAAVRALNDSLRTGRSSEAASLNSARTSSPDRPEERPTYCAGCGEPRPGPHSLDARGGKPCNEAWRWFTLDEMGQRSERGCFLFPAHLTYTQKAAWHAEHNPTERPPSDHEMEHVSVRGPADEEPKPETTCTAWGCLRTRDRERLYCDPCGGRVTTVDPHNLTKWRPVEDEPEEEQAGRLSSTADQDALKREQWVAEYPLRNCARRLYIAVDSMDLTDARREYARLGGLLREMEGES